VTLQCEKCQYRGKDVLCSLIDERINVLIFLAVMEKLKKSAAKMGMSDVR